MASETLQEKLDKFHNQVWIRDKKDESRHYLDTGVLGAYEMAGIINPKYILKKLALFSDTAYRENPDGLCLERKMIVDGKHFNVRSVFVGGGAATPTDKLLSVIDNEPDDG